MYNLSKQTLFEMWFSCPGENRREEIYKLVLNHLGIVTDTNSLETRALWKSIIKDFNNKVNARWMRAGKRMDRFLEKYGDWLDNSLCFDVVPPLVKEKADNRLGRPSKSFGEVLHRTKKQKIQHLLASKTEEITFAAEVALRRDGKRDAASIVKEICVASPGTSTKIKQLSIREKSSVKQQTYLKEEALALFIDCRLTKQSYITLRKSALEAGHVLYPSYKEIQKAKTECGPSNESIFVDEIKASINLQCILNHTVQRLIQVQELVLKQYASSMHLESFDCILTSKYGCDGSSGHSRYKQKFQGPEADDEYLFVFSLVPIRLQPIDNNKIYLWQNDRPSSTKLCRPIKFIISKETTEMVKQEYDELEKQRLKLLPTTFFIENIQINIHHQLHLTMVDGKLCNILTDTKSSQTCYICGATPKSMNNKPDLKHAKKENYGFGLSTLHARIRAFECLLHIGYKLKTKQWQVRGKEQQEEIKIRKLEIQKRFKSEMGLDVDKPKPGFGSSNDGNTARAFFSNPEKSSEITGVNEILIEKFAVILDAVCSGYHINLTAFEKYCQQTADIYIGLYSWYYMPVTVHKLLFHSTEIIKNCIVPIGQLSEEAQEARHKECRRYREHNTQKKSRSATNKDLLRMLLVSSDPVVSSYRQKYVKPNKSLSHKVLALLKCPELPSNVSENGESETESE